LGFSTSIVRSCALKQDDLMIKHAALLIALAAPAMVPGVALAQSANDRVLLIFGRDPCPAGTICVRAPEEERFRIPKQFRNSGPTRPENQSWASRANAAMDAGAKSGTGSCSAGGPGGWTGCWKQQMDAARAERKQENEQRSPLED
jgi:hypothetical protein